MYGRRKPHQQGLLYKAVSLHLHLCHSLGKDCETWVFKSKVRGILQICACRGNTGAGQAALLLPSISLASSPDGDLGWHCPYRKPQVTLCSVTWLSNAGALLHHYLSAPHVCWTPQCMQWNHSIIWACCGSQHQCGQQEVPSKPTQVTGSKCPFPNHPIETEGALSSLQG